MEKELSHDVRRPCSRIPFLSRYCIERGFLRFGESYWSIQCTLQERYMFWKPITQFHAKLGWNSLNDFWKTLHEVICLSLGHSVSRETARNASVVDMFVTNSHLLRVMSTTSHDCSSTIHSTIMRVCLTSLIILYVEQLSITAFSFFMGTVVDQAWGIW